jgi:hypothetical protein
MEITLWPCDPSTSPKHPAQNIPQTEGDGKQELPDRVPKLELGNQRRMKSFDESTETMVIPGFHVNLR